jgi:RNA polymerase sigma-70 factor (ECF subfamily)
MCASLELDVELSDLIQKIAAGEASALLSLYDASSRLLFGLILRITGDRFASEEELVEVYKLIESRAARYDPKEVSAAAWILSTARDCAVDRRRQNRRDSPKPDRLETAPAQSVEGSDQPACGLFADARKRALAAIESLPPEQRVAVELAYYAGMSPGEIAAQIGQPRAAIKTRIRLGMIKLAEQLK